MTPNNDLWLGADDVDCACAVSLSRTLWRLIIPRKLFGCLGGSLEKSDVYKSLSMITEKIKSVRQIQAPLIVLLLQNPNWRRYYLCYLIIMPGMVGHISVLSSFINIIFCHHPGTNSNIIRGVTEKFGTIFLFLGFRTSIWINGTLIGSLGCLSVRLSQVFFTSFYSTCNVCMYVCELCTQIKTYNLNQNQFLLSYEIQIRVGSVVMAIRFL